MPISRDEMRVFRQHHLAARDVGARIGQELSGAAARRRSIAGSPASSTSSVCSTITTASAPRGTIPPVAIVVAEPAPLQRRRMPRRRSPRR